MEWWQILILLMFIFDVAVVILGVIYWWVFWR
jgi:hypothetical protein